MKIVIDYKFHFATVGLALLALWELYWFGKELHLLKVKVQRLESIVGDWESKH